MRIRCRCLHHERRAVSHGWPLHALLPCHVCVHVAAHARCVAARDAHAYERCAHAPAVRRHSACCASRREQRRTLDGGGRRLLPAPVTKRGAASLPVPHRARGKIQGRRAQLDLRNVDDKGEDSACPRAGTRRMPDIFILAPHAALAKCPVVYVRLQKACQRCGFCRLSDIRNCSSYEPNAAAPASATAWSCSPDPPLTPMAPTTLPPFLSGMPPAKIITLPPFDA